MSEDFNQPPLTSQCCAPGCTTELPLSAGAACDVPGHAEAAAEAIAECNAGIPSAPSETAAD